MLSGNDIFLVPFSLLWGGFALFWNAAVWGIGGLGRAAPWEFRLWGLPFLILGIYFVVGRFVHDVAVRRRMAYAVTDRRVLVRRGDNPGRVRSVELSHLPKLELREHRDGTGTIEFEEERSPFLSGGNGFGNWAPALSKAMRLIHIENPKRVYQIICDNTRP